MSSIKARKGNPFEYDTAYNLSRLSNFDVTNLGDNTKGVDIIATDGTYKYYIECKFHQKFSWNELVKIFSKTEEMARKSKEENVQSLLIFKANRQPVLIMYRTVLGYLAVREFSTYFGLEFLKRPKGWKIWDNINKEKE